MFVADVELVKLMCGVSLAALLFRDKLCWNY